jgi:hypothetical protein
MMLGEGQKTLVARIFGVVNAKGGRVGEDDVDFPSKQKPPCQFFARSFASERSVYTGQRRGGWWYMAPSKPTMRQASKVNYLAVNVVGQILEDCGHGVSHRDYPARSKVVR